LLEAEEEEAKHETSLQSFERVLLENEEEVDNREPASGLLGTIIG
jgi:hypothetical protein